MRLFARETHIRTSFSNNVCNQNIRLDITNIYHLELIQLSQRPFVGQSVTTEAAAEAAIAYDMLSTRVLLAMFKQSFSRFVGPPSKCHSAPNGCTALTFAKFHSIFFGHAVPTLLVLFRQFCTLLSVFFSCSLLDCEIFRTLPVLFFFFCHLHLRFTHAKNNKIYLFPLPLTHYSPGGEAVSFFFRH